MQIDIRHLSGDILMTVQADTLSRANLSRAFLTRANLFGVDLSGANLRGAVLGGAVLSRAVLSGADLSGVDLSGVDLSRANLGGAFLSRANLFGANLFGANLGGATMPDGERWEEYLSDLVPALLTAGGKSVAEVVASGAWECHEWENCPMRVALGIKNVEGAPILIRTRVRQFVQLFDAKLIPCPVV